MHQSMAEARAYFESLNRDYNTVHKTKEDLFWATYMAMSDDHAGFAKAEEAYKDFVSNPARLHATRDHLARLQQLTPGPERDALIHGLKGWQVVQAESGSIAPRTIPGFGAMEGRFDAADAGAVDLAVGQAAAGGQALHHRHVALQQRSGSSSKKSGNPPEA